MPNVPDIPTIFAAFKKKLFRHDAQRLFNLDTTKEVTCMQFRIAILDDLKDDLFEFYDYWEDNRISGDPKFTHKLTPLLWMCEFELYMKRKEQKEL